METYSMVFFLVQILYRVAQIDLYSLYIIFVILEAATKIGLVTEVIKALFGS